MATSQEWWLETHEDVMKNGGVYEPAGDRTRDLRIKSRRVGVSSDALQQTPKHKRRPSSIYGFPDLPASARQRLAED